MKRILSILLITSAVFASEVKNYWNEFYPQIRQCVLEEVQTKEIYKPVLQVKTKQELINYFKSLDKPAGYYVIIDTSAFPSKDLCFIRYLLRKQGYESEYYSPVEKLLVDVFSRKQDAVYLQMKLRKDLKLEKEVVVLDVF